MKSLSPIALALAGCVVAEPVPVAPAPVPVKSAYTRELEKFRAEITQRRGVAPAPDHVASALISCSQLGFIRGSDGHQNCVMRAMDRIDFAGQRYLKSDDEISVRIPRPVEQPPVAVVPTPRCAPPCYVPQSVPAPAYAPGATVYQYYVPDYPSATPQ